MPLPPDSGSQPAVIRLFLLGEFRAERDGRAVPDGAWQRRGGKQLVKLLATVPDHRLHREQVLNLLWPELTPESAAGALRKALHHARHALEPTLPPRGESAYIRLHDDVVSLAGSSIRIDADEGQAMAETALETGDYEALVAALGAVGDELLPEDRYEDWTVARRSTLSDLHTRLLLRLADLEQETGRAGAAADRLRQIVARDPGREDVHRHLMRLAARHGHRHQALRQYQICCEALRREFDTLPEPETEALYQELLAGRDVPEPDGARLTDTARPFPAAAHRQATGMMVGRDPAFATVMEALRRAANGHGGALLIGGEAGVGKSRLAAEAARRAHDRGLLVLWGTADEQDGRLPYGVLVEALDRAVGSQAPDRREHLGTRFPELTGLLPSLRSASVGEAAGVAPHDTEGAGSSRTRIFAAIVALLDELRGRQPLMLVLDDLHAADAASLLIFSYLARMAGERPWLLVGTYRAGSVATRGDLKRQLTAVTRDRLAARLAIERLERDETDRLVASLLPGGTVPTDLLDDLFARTLGNPLFVRELVLTMRDEGTLSLSDGRWIVVPDATAAVPRQVRDLIDARVDRLGADVRQALTLAATAGMECSFRLLRDAGDFADAPLLDILDLALGANLLDERGDGYAFQHPLVRATLTEQLSRPRRARLHVALATAIERQAERAPSPRLAPIEALAHHWTEAGEPARAIPYLMQAADRAARVHANAEAIDRLRQALRLLDDLGDASTVNRAATLERLGDLHALIGEAEPARSAFATALEVGGLDALDRARLRRKCGRQALLAGALATAAVMLDKAEAALDEAADDQAATAERARILAVRAQSEFLAFRFPESLAAGEESLRLAEAANSPADVARACEMVAMACLPLGHWQRGMAFERRHESLSDLNAVVRDAADVHLCLSEYHLYGDQPAHAAREVLRALGEAERIGATRSLAWEHGLLPWAVPRGSHTPGRGDRAIPPNRIGVRRSDRDHDAGRDADCPRPARRSPTGYG